ncbi:MAG TPA: Flp pilus assembly protein CpaB, partial [Pirellulales bacterium]|nr:Flp pilus assembly protein CpaB [Pirellulales bacterium]
SIILLTLALGCGLIASIGINQVMANRRAVPATQTGETAPIFVAATEIGIGDPLTPQLLKLEPWPKEKVPAGALGKLEDVEGRRSRSKFYPGEPILEAKLLPKGENGGSAIDMIPKGMRVVPIRVDAVSGASGMILPGDRVDLLVHLREDPTHGVARAVTRTFLQRVKIFAVDDVYDRPGTENKALSAKTISVLVTPEQAELVGLATQLGNVQMVMRSASDDDSDNPGGADLQKLLLGRTDMDTSIDPQAFITAMKPKEPEPPAPPPTIAPVLEAEPEDDVFTMVILDGNRPRTIEFKRGKPVNAAAPVNTPPDNQAAPIDGATDNGATDDATTDDAASGVDSENHRTTD